MTYPLTALAGTLALVLAGHALAWGDCDHRRVVEESLPVGDSRSLTVIAGAGDLDITGGGGDTATVKATICASTEAWAEATGVDLAGGPEARIAVVLPDTSEGGSWGRDYAYVDLEIQVPESLALSVRDSSGDMDLRNVGAVIVKDSSGDIDIDGAASAEIEDSSGDIELARIARGVTIVSDSSGDIEGQNIGGSAIVARDSSGDIEFRDVEGDVIVERDSSGDIEARTVGGDFAVLRDGSGEIRHSGVQGTVEVPAED